MAQRARGRVARRAGGSLLSPSDVYRCLAPGQVRRGRGPGRIQWLAGLRLFADLGEQVGHLECGAGGVGALVDARLRLLGGVHREDAEGDWHAGLEPGELDSRGGLAGDVLEVGRLAANDTAEGDDAR